MHTVNNGAGHLGQGWSPVRTTPGRHRQLSLRKALGMRAQGEDGAALVETAIVLTVLFLMLFAVIQGGVIFGSWIVVTNAAREGARWGSPCVSRAELPFAAACDGAWSADDPAVNNSTIASYTLSRIAWPQPSDPIWAMNAAVSTDPVGAVPRLLRVRITYQVPLFAPLIGLVVSNPLPLFAESNMRVEE